MAEFKLEFDMGNAAFADGAGPDEVARILRQIAKRIEDRTHDDGPIIDCNGNTVGRWHMSLPMMTNRYTCPECGASWEDEWTCACDDDCPNCGTTCSPED